MSNRPELCKYLAALVAISFCLFTGSSSAIQRSDSGLGQYLIVPFAIATDDYETLLELVDTSQAPTSEALKLRVLDQDGEPRLLANLYLPRGSTWAAALTRQAGSARLVTAPDSDSCLLIDDGGAVTPVGSVDFEFEAGTVEIVEMGTVDNESLETPVLQGDCEAIAALWNDDAWAPNAALAPPEGALEVTARVVNVAKGTLYGVPATALAGFSDIVHHTAPGTAQPDLASTHDAGTPVGETRSVVCSNDGCVEDFWDNPIDAASAALMTYTARDRYEISESLAARNEWIVTYPTMAYYPEAHPLSSSEVSMLVTTRFGAPLLPGLVISDPDHPFASNTSLDLNYDQSLNVLDPSTTFEEVGEELPSALFGISHLVQSPAGLVSQLPEQGRIRLGFSSPEMAIEPASGRRYWGRPAIVTTFTEYTNGVLQGEDGVQQRANYGASGSVATSVRIDSPGE